MWNRLRHFLPLYVISCLPIVVANAVNAQELEAETVFVASEQAHVRSGPSKDDYPTSVIKRGTAVTSYHETDDGWLAIQPPPGSFSWVPATAGYLLPGGKSLEITSDKVVSWIGTKLGKAKQYRWQVELSAGEQLVVLGEASRKSADGQEALWYRVVPPNGEFRWIHRSDTSATPIDDAKPAKIVNTSATPLASTQATAQANDTESGKDAVQVAGASVESEPMQTPSSVQPAAYHEDVFSANAQPLRPIPSSSSGRRMTPTQQGDSNPWNGWHAWELTDDGLRFTLFDRLRGGSRTRDPLQSDPFDISMATKHVQKPSPTTNARKSRPPQVVQSGVRQPNFLEGSRTARSSSTNARPNTAVARNNRPWRDPRTLGRNSADGDYYPSDLAGNESIGSFADDRDGTFEDRSRPDFASEGAVGVRNRDRSPSEIEQRMRPGAEQLVNQIREGVGALGSSLRAGLNLTGTKDATLRPVQRDTEVPSFQSVDWYGVSTENDDLASSSGASRTRQQDLGQSPAYTEAELNRLQADLTAMVAAPPASWDLKDIKRRTEYLIKYGASPVARGRARLLLERVEEFEQHASKTAFTTFGNVTSASYTSIPSTLGSNSQIAPVSTAPVSTAQFNARSSDSSLRASSYAQGSRNYDATGWLVPVYGAQSSLPEYALTNRAGQTVAYVTTLPGMNLSVYLNKPVGIIGLRGYLPQLQANYIQAERVLIIKQ